MKKFFSFFIILSTLFIDCNAIVYQMELWKDDKENTIITLSDFHADTISCTTTFRQKQEIIDLAKELNAHCIFEDHGHYQGTNPHIIKELSNISYVMSFIKKTGWMIPSWVEKISFLYDGMSPLFNLTTEAQSQGVQAESAEFRYANGCAFYATVSSFCYPGYKITLEEAYKELTSKITDIDTYKDQDGPVMKKIYDFSLSLFNEFDQKNFNILKEFSINPKNTITSLPEKNQSILVETGIKLLDIEIFHRLYTQLKSGKKTFIIYAGGGHIEIMNYGFICMGFNKKGKKGKEESSFFTSEKETREAIQQSLNIPEAYKDLEENSK